MVMNKAESLDDGFGSVAATAGEARTLGFGDPIALPAETGLGMNDLYEVLRPLLEDHMFQMVDTAGWLQRARSEKGASSLSIVQSKKNPMRAHVVALVLDGEEVTRIPVVFVSALEGKGRIDVMQQVVETYKKWSLRLSTVRLNRWLRKAKVKYFTQVKARPPAFVAFVTGKTRLADTDLRFLARSLKEDFDNGGIPVRILQPTVEKKDMNTSGNSNSNSNNKSRKK